MSTIEALESPHKDLVIDALQAELRSVRDELRSTQHELMVTQAKLEESRRALDRCMGYHS